MSGYRACILVEKNISSVDLLKIKTKYFEIGYDGKGYYQWNGREQIYRGWKLNFTVDNTGLCTGYFIDSAGQGNKQTQKLVHGTMRGNLVRLTCTFVGNNYYGQINVYEGQINERGEYKGRIQVLRLSDKNLRLGHQKLDIGTSGGNVRLSYV